MSYNAQMFKGQWRKSYIVILHFMEMSQTVNPKIREERFSYPTYSTLAEL